MFFPISVRFLLLIPGRNVGSTLQYVSIKNLADLKEDTYYRTRFSDQLHREMSIGFTFGPIQGI